MKYDWLDEYLRALPGTEHDHKPERYNGRFDRRNGRKFCGQHLYINT